MTQRRELRFNKLDFFESPEETARQLARYAFVASLPPGARVCDPSCGRAALLLAARAERRTDDLCYEGVELDWDRWQMASAHGFAIHHGDTLSYTPVALYDVILTNPPFSVAGERRTWMKHIYHVWNWLAPDGMLSAIVPDTWIDDQWHAEKGEGRIRREFYEFVDAHGYIAERLPMGHFKEVGTNVATAIIVLNKSAGRPDPYLGWPSWYAYDAHRYLAGAPDHLVDLPLEVRLSACLSHYTMSPLLCHLTDSDWQAIKVWDYQRALAASFTL